MVKPLQGVLLRPIVNWRARHSKILFEYDREERVKKVR